MMHCNSHFANPSGKCALHIMLRVELLTVLLHECEGVATGRQLLMADVQEGEELQVGNAYIRTCAGAWADPYDSMGK